MDDYRALKVSDMIPRTKLINIQNRQAKNYVLNIENGIKDYTETTKAVNAEIKAQVRQKGMSMERVQSSKSGRTTGGKSKRNLLQGNRNKSMGAGANLGHSGKLSVIQEEGAAVLSPEKTLEIRKKMCDGRDFFKDVKKELNNVEKELNLTRMGCQVSQDYKPGCFVQLKFNIEPEILNNTVRQNMIKHNPEFQHYKDENTVRPRSAYDFGSKVTKKAQKALVNKSDAMNELMSTCSQIQDNRKKQIKIGFEAFKSRQNNVFADPDIKTGKTVKSAIGEDIRNHEKEKEKTDELKATKNLAREEKKSAEKTRARAAAGLSSPSMAMNSHQSGLGSAMKSYQGGSPERAGASRQSNHGSLKSNEYVDFTRKQSQKSVVGFTQNANLQGIDTIQEEDEFFKDKMSESRSNAEYKDSTLNVRDMALNAMNRFQTAMPQHGSILKKDRNSMNMSPTMTSMNPMNMGMQKHCTMQARLNNDGSVKFQRNNIDNMYHEKKQKSIIRSRQSFIMAKINTQNPQMPVNRDLGMQKTGSLAAYSQNKAGRFKSHGGQKFAQRGQPIGSDKGPSGQMSSSVGFRQNYEKLADLKAEIVDSNKTVTTLTQYCEALKKCTKKQLDKVVIQSREAKEQALIEEMNQSEGADFGPTEAMQINQFQPNRTQNLRQSNPIMAQHSKTRQSSLAGLGSRGGSGIATAARTQARGSVGQSTTNIGFRQSQKDMVDIVEIQTEQFESPREDYQRLNIMSPQNGQLGQKDRVKSAAAVSIQRKWGYDTSGVLQGTQINMKTFMSNGSMRDQHASLMRRLDNSLEGLALNQDGDERQAWINEKNRVRSEAKFSTEQEKQQDMLYKVPELNEIYTKPAQRIVDPLKIH